MLCSDPLPHRSPLSTSLSRFPVSGVFFPLSLSKYRSNLDCLHLVMDGARQMEWLVLQPGRSKPAPHRFIPSSLAQQQLTLLHDAKKTGAQLLQEQQRIISRDDADALAQSVAQAPPATSTMGQTLLHYASAAGALECVRWLVAAHAELIDAKTRDGEVRNICKKSRRVYNPASCTQCRLGRYTRMLGNIG